MTILEHYYYSSIMNCCKRQYQRCCSRTIANDSANVAVATASCVAAVGMLTCLMMGKDGDEGNDGEKVVVVGDSCRGMGVIVTWGMDKRINQSLWAGWDTLDFCK